MAEVVQLARHHHFLDFDQGRQRDHCVIAATHKNFLDVVRRVALGGVGLHDHVVLVTLALVTRDLTATHHGLDRAGNGVHRHTHVGGTLAVHLHADLGLVQSQVGVHADDARVFGQLVLEGTHHLRQVLVTVGRENHKVHRALTEGLAQ